MAESGWDCEAYGPDLRGIGAVCFFSGEPGQRVCVSQDECREAMVAERQRVFRRIQELSSGDDPTGAYAYLEQEITSPGQILGGGDD